ncbi:phage tail assembly chaperone [Methylobacterium platani]|uniref:Uncharacterized protein n=2 Tax=Methylobacterium platani TaxID=427683 RepID=A0A179S4L3_9HYPH|nr:hypothetical protein [Methylobacterium platani]KMO21615.1 hypothetical protein SQ03_02795 [Methylobacterium platani JCM 14648]OAS19099.1 hypothetical protein A5481_25225 [Methylobacterium platani]
MASERKIGAHVYRCEKLPATEGLPLLLRVTRFFGAAPAMLLSIVSNASDAPSAFLATCMGTDVDPSETQALLTDLAQSCTTGGNPCVVGVKPQSIEDLVSVAWFALEVNFKDFLVASLSKLPASQEA